MIKINKKAFTITLAVTVIESIIYYLVKVFQGSPNLIGSTFDNCIFLCNVVYYVDNYPLCFL